jgi:hypothetical protein
LPFALIQRVTTSDPDEPKQVKEFLVVRGLRGCEAIHTDIDVHATRDANIVARRIIDSTFLSIPNGCPATPSRVIGIPAK